MESHIFKCLIWITIVYQSSQFIIIDDELESLFDVSAYNLSKVENSSAILTNQTDDDISQLFELYDKVFNITEASESELTSTTNNEDFSTSDVTQEIVLNNNNTDTLLNNTEYLPNTTVIIENEKESKTDALLIESVEKIGDAEVQKEFIKEVETVQQSFNADDVEYKNEKNVSVSPIDDLTGYVIEENEEMQEPFINYNAIYEEKLVPINVTEQNFNETVNDIASQKELNNTDVTEEEFKLRRIEQVLEARISSIIFGESFSDEDVNNYANQTDTDDDTESTDEIMIAMETNLDHENQTWNGTLVQNSTETLNEMEEESDLKSTEVNSTDFDVTSTTDLEYSTTEVPEFTTEVFEENVIDFTETPELISSSDDITEEKHDLSSIESNLSAGNLNHDLPISPKTARGLTDIGIKNALSQEKHKLTDLLNDHANTLNMTSLCMITLSVLTLCLLCVVCLLLIIQKLKLLRHSDTVAPA